MWEIDRQEREKFVREIKQGLVDGVKYDKRQIAKIALSYGLADPHQTKELAERAVVERARELAHQQGNYETRYARLVQLYHLQMNLSHRSSMSILLQQYSTPAPVSYLAGVFVGADKGISVFEPSAGNGLLTIAADIGQVTANEIDTYRRDNLVSQGYRDVTALDATEPFTGYTKKFDAVLTNPPFGKLDQPEHYGKYGIRALEHLMALRALDTMKDSGKAAIIIGRHTRWDEKGRVQAGRNRIFLSYLYHHYHVMDIINLYGRNIYSRQGTSFNVRLILIAGRKATPEGAAPLKDPGHDKPVKSFDELFERVMQAMKKDQLLLRAHALKLKLSLMELNGLDAPYTPASRGMSLKTEVPDAMEYEQHQAIGKIAQAVGGDIDEFVRERLDYQSKEALHKVLSAEQVDAVAMGIYNIEAKQQAMIIGDQTGIGKGRVAASFIRYAVLHGYRPIFLTEKANLFSDLYRDLQAIGAGGLVPFIVNERAGSTHVKDASGNIIHRAPVKDIQQAHIEENTLPEGSHFIMATYSQFSGYEPDDKKRKNKNPGTQLKPQFLRAMGMDNIFILDESHNASGSGNTGQLMREVLAQAKGCVFLSATFAKTPKNMPLYAIKTAISDALMTSDMLINAVQKGGVPLQEILSSQLVGEAQMIRRERSYEGIEVNYITMEGQAAEHTAIADNITLIMREIIRFQAEYIIPMVSDLDRQVSEASQEAELRKGTDKAGVDSLPYFSKLFNVINQMLFSIKAEAVAEKAIARLKEGKKPVIAFSSTMGSFVEQLAEEDGKVEEGTVIPADFSEVLRRGLESVMQYTVVEPDGSREYHTFSPDDLDPVGQAEYHMIMGKIEEAATGITISPIDIIIEKIESAGYTVAEVTGRKLRLEFVPGTDTGMVMRRKKVNVNDAFRDFNNNHTDVLLINQSGATGASAHAIPTESVPASKIKQRVMIIIQPELDITKEVQKRGRINRTGQIYLPIYDYMSSAIPAEQRLMMMLQQKLKSLDANTTSNQKNSKGILDVPDFLNKYGNRVVIEYLMENPTINHLLGDPLNQDDEGYKDTAGMAHKVSGRVAVLSVAMQEDFYRQVTTKYNDLVDMLKQQGDYDLEVEALDLQAETLETEMIIMGTGGNSAFGKDTFLETVKARVLKKPFSRSGLENLLKQALQGRDGKGMMQETIDNIQAHQTGQLESEKAQVNDKYEKRLKAIPYQPSLQKLEGQPYAYEKLLAEREAEVKASWNEALQKSESRIRARYRQVLKVFNFFYPGKPLQYTIVNGVNIMAVCLGFDLDHNKENPYAPSSIKLRVAIANTTKLLVIPLSQTSVIDTLIGASMDVKDEGIDTLLDAWQEEVQQTSQDYATRYIVTGNILQAYGNYDGKLVSYTTSEGETKKGILMPESWEKPKKAEVAVPASNAKVLKAVRSLVNGRFITTNNNISIFKQPEGFRIIAYGGRNQGGQVYLDAEILQLVEGNNFHKTGDKMAATLALDKIIPFLTRLEALGDSVDLDAGEVEASKPAGESPLKTLPLHLPKALTLPPDQGDLLMRARLLKLKLALLKI